jgi:cob(I)alamin adenosyltransferase
MKQGKIYIFTGDGKGKTSAALGVVVRAVGNGMKVAWVGWYKQKSWRLSELKSLKILGVKVYLMGKGFRIKEGAKELIEGSRVIDKASEEEHKISANKALKIAKDLIQKVDVLVLDEVNNAVMDRLINTKSLIKLIEKRGNTHLILTGRGVKKEMVELADLVTKMEKVKHPYDKGELAIKGLDF